MRKYMELIDKSNLLGSVSADDINSYLNSGSLHIKSYGKGCIIHSPGEACSRLELILSGKVAVENIDESGNLMTIAVFGWDDILGGNLLFGQNPRYPMTITATQATVILGIGKEEVLDLFSRNNIFLRNYLEYVAEKTTILGNCIQYNVNRPLRERILNYLENECLLQNSRRIRLKITKKALAERMGVQRTSLSRELAKMEKDGLIEFDSKSIELL